MDTILCIDCAQEKPLSAFTKAPHVRSGYAQPCNACRYARTPLDPTTLTTLTCLACRIEKPIDEFYEDRSYRTHRTPVCIACTPLCCTRCRIVKPVSEFYKAYRQAQRIQQPCIDCKNVVQWHKRVLTALETVWLWSAPRVTKPCHYCHQDFPMTAFIAVARTKRNPEGRGNQCRLCRNKAINARYAVRVAEDPDSVHTQQAQWRHNNPEAQTKARRNWEKNHPEKSAAKRMRRRALLANAPIVENVSPDVIFRRDKGICGLCGKRVKKADISIDHVIPLSCGGAHSKQNCVLAHQRCNSAKNNKAVPQQQRLFG